MIDAPLVTVLMPLRNAGAFLAQAIESILAQTMREFELLIIDNGSTDDSLRIARSFRDRRMRVRAESADHNFVTSLNEGLEEAAAPFVARMDADDVAFPHRLERQLAHLRAHPGVGICGSWYLPFDQSRDFGATRLPEDHAGIGAKLLLGSPFAHPTVIMDKARMKSFGLRYSAEAHPAEDYDLWERARAWIRMATFPRFSSNIAAIPARSRAGVRPNSGRSPMRYARESSRSGGFRTRTPSFGSIAVLPPPASLRATSGPNGPSLG